jgi:hypothetical protein
MTRSPRWGIERRHPRYDETYLVVAVSYQRSVDATRPGDTTPGLCLRLGA